MMTPRGRMKTNRKQKSLMNKAIAFVVLLQLVQEAKSEHWPNYWSPINHGDEVIPGDDRTNVPPPPPVVEPAFGAQRNRDAGLIGRRQLYLEGAKKRPMNPPAAAPAIIGYNHPIPESDSKVPADTVAPSSDWVPMQADPMKGDPLFEYNPPALQTVKLGEFQADSEEEDTFSGASPLLQAYSGSVDPASLLLASTLMLNNPLADDAIDRSDVGDDDSTAFIDDSSHPYYGAGRIKVAMDDPNSKERLPFTSNQANSPYSPGNPALRRTTIMPLSNSRETTDELLETTTVGSSEQKTTRLVYQSPPKRVKTTERPSGQDEEEDDEAPPTGEESLLSFLQNWLQASSPEQPKPTPAVRTTAATRKVPTTTTAATTTSTTTRTSTTPVPSTEETADDEVTAPVTTEAPVTLQVPKIKLEQRNRFQVGALDRVTNRPLRFPIDKTTKQPFTSVEELAHAVRPLVSSVPFIIVQGHSKVKMYGVNTLESQEIEKHAPGSKAQLDDKVRQPVVTEDDEEHDEVTQASTESEEYIPFHRDPAVERPIATKQPRPPRPQQQQNRRPPPADFRFPNQKNGLNGGGKRPYGLPLRNGAPPPRPQLRPMRPVFFTKRNQASGSPNTHSNPFEYFSQLARLTASRIKATPSPDEEPLTPRAG